MNGFESFDFFFFLASQLISLIASANNMSTIKNKADKYAAQIMEEFDPEGFGYITVSFCVSFHF